MLTMWAIWPMWAGGCWENALCRLKISCHSPHPGKRGFWWVIHRQIRAWNTILLEFSWHGPGSGCPYVPSPIKHGIQASHFLGMVQKGCRLFWTRTCMSASRYRLSCSFRLPLTNNLFILVLYSVAYPGFFQSSRLYWQTWMLHLSFLNTALASMLQLAQQSVLQDEVQDSVSVSVITFSTKPLTFS